MTRTEKNTEKFFLYFFFIFLKLIHSKPVSGTAGTDETIKIFNFYQPREESRKKKHKNYKFMAFNECHTTVR